jgi:lysophospholipase L1-like esterase
MPDTGLDYWLTQLGHNVTTVAVSGGNNLNQFDKITDADYIIWMQTETNRDLLSAKIEGTTFTELSAQAAENNYKLAQQVDIPFIVVGCLSPLHESIKKYTFYTHRIDSWLAELTGYEPTLNIHSDYMRQVIEMYRPTDKKFLIGEIDRMLAIETALETHPAFSDGVHPSAQSYKELAGRLHLMITADD